VEREEEEGKVQSLSSKGFLAGAVFYAAEKKIPLGRKNWKDETRLEGALESRRREVNEKN